MEFQIETSSLCDKLYHICCLSFVSCPSCLWGYRISPNQGIQQWLYYTHSKKFKLLCLPTKSRQFMQCNFAFKIESRLVGRHKSLTFLLSVSYFHFNYSTKIINKLCNHHGAPIIISQNRMFSSDGATKTNTTKNER